MLLLVSFENIILVAIKPILVAYQIVVNLIKIANEEAVANSTLDRTSKPIKLASVNPIPPGINETAPIINEVKVIRVVSTIPKSKLKAMKEK